MANFLAITHDTLDAGVISKLVSHEKCGAVSLFVGTTRDTFDGKQVHSLEYEAYESMAYKELENLCIDLRRLWPGIVNIALYHRLGLVAPKEASVVIAIATPHRQASLEAVSYAIDQLKRNVPIWKKELYDDGASEWKQNKEAFCFAKSKIDNEVPVPKELVQIGARKVEVKNRIACFLAKKREEIDQNNIMDYICNPINNDVSADSCARVNSALIRQESNTSHLKIGRVTNLDGPQTTRPNYLGALDNLMGSDGGAPSAHTKTAVKEEKNSIDDTVLKKRIETVEQHLFHSSNDHLPVHMRLKAIEDRLLRLESISPEYYHFMLDATNNTKNSDKGDINANKQAKAKHEQDNAAVVGHKVHKYSVNELNSLIQEIQNYNNIENTN
ncbi:molybdopterin synthase catalytic subunit [Eurosta solidaginis]|uniref:molybdopterin synthase catalytic subunit n=1 Tax=Eurosta solidaginis TaxID=178769 RepID=UPI003530CFC2